MTEESAAQFVKRIESLIATGVHGGLTSRDYHRLKGYPLWRSASFNNNGVYYVSPETVTLQLHWFVTKNVEKALS